MCIRDGRQGRWTTKMVNLNWLAENATPLEINTSVLGNVNIAVPNMIENANTVSLGYYGVGVMLCVFIYIMIRTNTEAGGIRLDLARSALVSSGITFILGFVMNVSGLVSSYQNALWFFTLFVVSLVWVYYLKLKNL